MHVFEVFDAKKKKRAVAGGGRYDTLVAALSDGKVDLPAVGFAIGDVVLRNMIEDTPSALEKMQAALDSETACDVFIVVADPEQQRAALSLATKLRSNGIAVSYSLTAAKFNKQFKEILKDFTKVSVFPFYQVRFFITNCTMS